MKKIALFLAIVMTAASLAACSTDEPDTTTANTTGTGETPAQTTQSSTEAETTSTPDTDDPAQTTEEDPATPPTPGAELSYPAEDVFKIPGGKVGDTELEGYDASILGAWDVVDDKLTSAGNSSIFIVTNDRMSAGKLTATFTSLEGSAANDNGIVFGLEDNFDAESYWFWEDPSYTPPYYFLFVSDASTLYLARVASNGEVWHELAQSQQIIGYAHGSTVTISVEFDGEGNINCYANDELLIEYKDTNGPAGSRYGVRAEVPGVVYHEVIAEHAE